MTDVRSIAGAGVIKPLVSVVALVLGLGAMALSLTIQQDPHAFTRPKILPDSGETERLERNVEIPLVEMAFVPTARLDSVIRVDEVAIEGRIHKALRKNSMFAQKVADAGPLPTKVLAAPCHDGEYRLLDPHRGVRLMCPGGSL